MTATLPQITEIQDLTPDVAALLSAHHAEMRALSPVESCHVMTGSDLWDQGARLFALAEPGGKTLAVGALKTVAPGGAPPALDLSKPVVELKSMHVAAQWRNRCLGRVLLSEMLRIAKASGAAGACLETGSAQEFSAARALYLSQGFSVCPPFGDYAEDPISVFMYLKL